MPSGGEALVAGLEAAGVEVVFGLPGAHNLPAWSALADAPVRLVTVRHEQTAGYAADGYARASGRAGVALTTTGPGAANTLTACGEAWAAGSPVVVVATDIPSALRRAGVYRGALHEVTDQAAMFAPVTKARLRADDPADLPHLAVEAVATALAAPSRPVYLEVPADLLRAHTPDVTVEGPAAAAAPGLRSGDVAHAAALLDAAERPLVWAGGGALRADAGEEVARLAARLAAPVLLTFQARGLLPPDHPCVVGLPPHVPEAGTLWDDADAVVAVGSDLDGMNTQNWAMPAPPRLVAVNVDEVDATKNYGADVVVVGDAAHATAALADHVHDRGGVESLRGDLDRRRAAALDRLRGEHPAEFAFLDAVATALPDDAVVVADMCIPGYWLGAFHPVPAPRKLSYPIGWGTLGAAFPSAIGAALAGAGRAVSISGDGGFLYACGELATVAQEDVGLTAVVVDDGGYGMLRYDQRRTGAPLAGIDLASPDFAALAASFGVRGETVDGVGEEFGAALARHVAAPQPSVLVARARLRPPPTTSPRWYRAGRD